MNEYEINLYKAHTFGRPKRIPTRVAISNDSWLYYKKPLEDIVLRYKWVFPFFKKGGVDWNNLTFSPEQSAGTYRDYWGCVWEIPADGMFGAVRANPLEKWDSFASFTPPDPACSNGTSALDWQKLGPEIKKMSEEGVYTAGSLEHGYMLLRLTYLRGFENVMLDMLDEDPNLPKLIGMVESFNASVIRKYLDAGVKLMAYPEDLGTQNNSILSPALFRKYIKPSYKRLMSLAKTNKALVHVHSDGRIIKLIDDLIECGVDILNLQDRVNGVDAIAKDVKGRVCIDLDVDRQDITHFGTPNDIDELIREEVMKLGSPEGGLTMVYHLSPGLSLENISAVMNAMEKYSTYYS